jgi:hypothetical protein
MDELQACESNSSKTLLFCIQLAVQTPEPFDIQRHKFKRNKNFIKKRKKAHYESSDRVMQQVEMAVIMYP